MNRILHAFVLSVLAVLPAAAQWSPAGDKIRTPWADAVLPDAVLPEYPRPIMRRDEWQNLNGLWDYAVVAQESPSMGAAQGQILVPFAVESSLSGVMRRVGRDKALWYSRRFSVPKSWRDRHVLLHFGAVDWQADVWLNGIRIGGHRGGYSGFSFDITPYLSREKEQTLEVRVWDPTDNGYQPTGKQRANPGGIWYTPVTGIWQTVWLEPVAPRHITALHTRPDIDSRRLSLLAATVGTEPGDIVCVRMRDDGRTVAEARAAVGEEVVLALPEMKLWSPDAPFLYDLDMELLSGGKTADRVASYAAMRKISTRRDADGVVRMQLNNEDLFQFGPLDQGYWPDGLYTAPTDEALRFDIEQVQRLGFNMIRKHMKVEPDRWYTWCDRLGILVWQDMPCADESPRWQSRNYFDGTERIPSTTSEDNFRREWREVMDALDAHPCIVVWTPFNEAWGQFKTAEIAAETQRRDPTRLVNSASGGNHYRGVGDILDLHNYPAPDMYLYDSLRVNVLGEYGGLGLTREGHTWQQDKNWGYRQFEDEQAVTRQYVAYAEALLPLIRRGFSAAVYTQLTDVEVELNGFFTYDRRLLKMDADSVRAVNTKVCGSLRR